MSDLALVLPVPEPDLAALPLDLLRAHRRELLAERVRAGRWRRLVQARLDLAIDLAAPTEDLRAPAGDVPQALCAGLRDLVHPSGASPERSGQVPLAVGALGDLPQVEAAKACLATYTATLDDRLGAATEELVRRYRAAPGSALDALDDPPGAGL